MLAHSAPPMVESSASVESDPRSRSREVRDSSGGGDPALALPGSSCHVPAVIGKGDVVPTPGLVCRVAGLTSCALAPQPIRGRVDKCVLSEAHHASSLPACGLSGPGRGLRTAPGAVEFARTLGVSVRSLDESARTLCTAAGSIVTVCGHAVPATGLVTVRGHETSRFFPLTSPVHGREKLAAKVESPGSCGGSWFLPGLRQLLSCG